MTMNTTDRVGIEFISVLGLDPIRFIDTARELDCRWVGMGLEPIASCKGIDANWSLRKDAALRKNLIAVMRAQGVGISVAEGFVALPGVDFPALAAPDLEIFAELGATRANFLTVDADTARATDQCAKFVELAATFGMSTTIEFLPGLPLVNDLPSALGMIEAVGRPDLRVLLDAMHVFRSGASVSDIANLDPAVIGYVQLCDVPLSAAPEDYADEARFERLPPGEGELPLQAFVDALPTDVFVGLELPMRSRAEAGLGAIERLRDPLLRTHQMLAPLHAA